MPKIAAAIRLARCVSSTLAASAGSTGVIATPPATDRRLDPHAGAAGRDLWARHPPSAVRRRSAGTPRGRGRTRRRRTRTPFRGRSQLVLPPRRVRLVAHLLVDRELRLQLRLRLVLGQ